MQTPEETDEEGFTFKRRKRSANVYTVAAYPPNLVSSSPEKYPTLEVPPLKHKQLSPASPISPAASRIRQPAQPIPIGKPAMDTYTQISENLPFHSTEEVSLLLESRENEAEEQWLMQAKPPTDHIPMDDFYKLIKPDMPDASRMKQILIWVATRLLQDESSNEDIDVSDKTAVKAEQIATQYKNRLLTELLKGQVETSWYRRPLFTDRSLGEKQPHPKNVKNEKSIREYESRIAVFDEEIDQWRKASNKIFESHAATLDAYEAPSGPIRVKFDESYLSNLDTDQLAFLKTCRAPHAKLAINKTITGMDRGVSELRQTLNTMSQFQQVVGQYADNLMANITQRVRKRSSLTGDAPLSVLDEEREDELQQEKENQTARDVLCLLSRCQK